MSIWTRNVTVGNINDMLKHTMCSHVGIEVTEIGDNFLKATLPVDPRTWQHQRILHGGALVTLAETVATIAANLSCKPDHHCVGLEINANYIRPGKPPAVVAIARALHIGSSTQVWDIKIYDGGKNLVCTSRLTLSVLKS